MRPRSAGTFLISRPETSAKLCGAAQDALDVLAVEVLDGEQMLHAASTVAPEREGGPDTIVTSSHAVELLDADVDALVRAVGRFLPT